MRMRPARFWRVISSFTLLAALLSLPAVKIQAQEQPKPGAAQTENKPAENAASSQERAEQKDEKGKEAKGEEKEGMDSPLIHSVAKATGLSVVQVYWISVGLNFAIVFFLIVYFLRKKLPGVFSARTESIQKGMEEARKSSEEARARLTEVEGRLSRLDAEIAQMRSEADEIARSEERRLQAESEDERRRIVAAAEQEISAAAGSARRDLKNYAAELALDLAEKKIRVDKTADQELVRDFAAGLGKDGN